MFSPVLPEGKRGEGVLHKDNRVSSRTPLTLNLGGGKEGVDLEDIPGCNHTRTNQAMKGRKNTIFVIG